MKNLINKNMDNFKKVLYKDYSAQQYADICQEIYSEVIGKYFTVYHGVEGEEKCTLNPYKPKWFRVKA